MESGPTDLTLFADLVPSFSNPGFTFVDWSTTPDNSAGSTVYADGASYSFASSIKLYAQWAQNSVTFHENDSSSDPIEATQSSSTTEDLTPFAALNPSFANPGFTFIGWNTEPDGDGVGYANAATYAFDDGDLNLYAQWAPESYVITFDANGGVVSPATASFSASSPLVTLPTPTYAGYTFDGWFTTLTGGTLVGVGGATHEFSGSTTVYAQWTSTSTAAASVIVSFSANGGAGSIAALSGLAGTSMVVPGGTGLSEANHTFAGWNTEADGSGTGYNVGQSITPTASLTLYAQWDALLIVKAPAILIGAVEVFAKNSAVLTPTLKDQVRLLASLVKAGHYVTVTLYGYTPYLGTRSAQMALSTRRAAAVAAYLKTELASLHEKGLVIKSAGEGAVRGDVGAAYGRVEVFVTS